MLSRRPQCVDLHVYLVKPRYMLLENSAINISGSMPKIYLMKIAYPRRFPHFSSEF